MDKKNQKTTTGSQGQEQDNIGYENTERRSDRDDKEGDREQTTDTGKPDEDQRVGSKIPEAKEEEGDEEVFGNL